MRSVRRYIISKTHEALQSLRFFFSSDSFWDWTHQTIGIAVLRNHNGIVKRRRGIGRIQATISHCLKDIKVLQKEHFVPLLCRGNKLTALWIETADISGILKHHCIVFQSKNLQQSPLVPCNRIDILCAIKPRKIKHISFPLQIVATVSYNLPPKCSTVTR